MSNQSISFINQPNKYIVPFVGDNFPANEISDQISNITKDTTRINMPQISGRNMMGRPKQFNVGSMNDNGYPNMPSTQTQTQTQSAPTEQNIEITSDRYDPYVDYLLSRGMINNENSVRYEVTAINIDSKFRQSQPIVTVFDTNLLTTYNPLRLHQGSNILTIIQPEHTYSVGDRIMISGINNPLITIRCGGTFTGLIFTVGSSTVIVQYNSDTTNPINIPSGYDVTANTVNPGNLLVQITGFVGNSSGSGTYFDNVPINSINGIHSVQLLKDASNNYYPMFALSQNYDILYGGLASMSPFNIVVTFFYISGIPVNIMNAGFPTTATNLKDYQTIIGTTVGTYSVSLDKAALLNYTFGGSSVIVSKINDIQQGYSNPNYYIIPLDKIYRNVYMVRMISSEFPNSENVLKDSTSSGKQNNKIYWQNQDDGDYIYSIQIPTGNYNPTDLTNALQTAFYNTPRINYATDVLNPNAPRYTDHNYLKVNINTNTDIVTFTSYREAFFVKPFVNISPTIQLNASQDPAIPYVGYVLTVYHPNHHVTVGMTILIAGAISYYGIPTSALNAEQQINTVIDTNHYTVKLDAFNLSSTRDNNGGGASVGIYVPDNIRFHFEYSDTMGQVLGFRNVGQPNSITVFGTTISNNEPYDNEYAYNSVGQTTTITNNALIMCGDSYILMGCTELALMGNVGPGQNIFAKILLSGLPGKVLFNTFICVPKVFYEPIAELSSLEITFYSPDGTLFNFNGLDHSFTLEITTVTNILKNTNLSERTIKTL